MQSNPKPGREHRRFSVLLLVVFVVLFAGPVQPISAQQSNGVTVTQEPITETASPGGTVTFVANVSAPDGYNGAILDVNLSDGWEIVSQESNGTYKQSEHQWVWLYPSNATAQFTVRVPDNATSGDYPVTATGHSKNSETGDIETDRTNSIVTVQTTATATATTSPGDAGGSGAEQTTTSTASPSSPTATTASPTPKGTTSPTPTSVTDRPTTTAIPATTTTVADPGTGGSTDTETTPIPVASTPARTTASATSSPGQDGAGVILALVALLSAGWLAVRHHSQ